MKYYLIALLIIIASCNNTTDNHTEDLDISNNSESYIDIDSTYIDTNSYGTGTITTGYEVMEQYAIVYIVVPDSGNNYYTLRDLMFSIHKSLDIRIDTIGRYYSAAKDEIIYPEDLADVGAGAYLPRRSGEDYLSIEHTAFYHNSNDNNTMMLVAGIFEEKNSADSLAIVITKAGFPTYVVKTAMYMGCLF